MRTRADAASKHIDAPTLQQILQYLPADLQSSASDIEAVEIEVELEQLSLIPGALPRVLDARDAGNQIAFISDMHIGAAHLEPRLRELGLFIDGDHLLVSSDVPASKSRGGHLFEHFLNVHDVDGGSVTHLGNSEWSDVKMAAKFGITSALCPSANLNRYEQLFVDASKNGHDLERFASLARDVRLQFDSSGAKPVQEIDLAEESLTNVSASVVAPVFISFVLWIIERCRTESITSIRFLTRDGELAYSIAKALPKEITEGLDFGMLEVSRKSLLLPAASVLPIDSWLSLGVEPGSFLVQQYDQLPAWLVISRSGLTFEKHAAMLAEFDIVDPSSPLGEDGLRNWKRALKSEAVRNEIQLESGKRLIATNAYLQQNLVDVSGKRSALVDIGWTGQQAAMLSSLIRNLGGEDPLHLFIGRLRERSLIAPADINGWLFDEPGGQPTPVANPVALFESFCTTTSGGVEGYELQPDGAALAIRRKQNHQPSLLSWGQPKIRDCVLRFTELTGPWAKDIDSELLRQTCERVLKKFWEHPTKHEAIKWGAFPLEKDQSGDTVQMLANPYNLAQIKSRLTGSYTGADWKAGSFALSPSPIRQILKAGESVRQKLGK